MNDTLLVDDSLPTEATFFLSGNPLFGPGYTLLGLGSVVDTLHNSGPSVLDLGACFDRANHFQFDTSIPNCLKTWKAAQWKRYKIDYFASQDRIGRRDEIAEDVLDIEDVELEVKIAETL